MARNLETMEKYFWKIAPFVGVAMGFAFAIPRLNESAYQFNLSKVEIKAVYQYGDEKPPFTEEERYYLYKDLGVDVSIPGARPEESKLLEYLKNPATQPSLNR